MQYEVCIDSLDGALAADKYGADRVELCSAHEVGGLTPSIGLAKVCIEKSNQAVYAMVRPEAGGFVYSSESIAIMKTDILAFADAGVAGVVFGVLDGDNNIDLKANAQLVEVAKSRGIKTVFHRAFDMCSDPIKGLDQIIEMGFDRLLTSGQEATAIDGLGLIEKLVKRADGRIEVMAGSGVNASNVEAFRSAGLDAVHFTGVVAGGETSLGMGTKYRVDEEKIRSIIA